MLLEPHSSWPSIARRRMASPIRFIAIRSFPVSQRADTASRRSLAADFPAGPIGRHRYFHKLYALDKTLDLRSATKSQVERAMQGHVLANAELSGTYQKGDR